MNNYETILPSLRLTVGKRLLLSNTTEVFSRYGFRADFKNLTNRAWGKSSVDSLLKQPAWQKFVTAVDTNQFTKRTLMNRLTLQCRQAVTWTDSMSKYYFGKGASGQGYFGLRKDYPDFDSIIQFSNVVYSSDRNKALCYFSEASDSLAGAGYIVFLEQSPTSWQPVGWLMLWIS